MEKQTTTIKKVNIKSEPIDVSIIKAVEAIALSCYGVRDLKNKSLFYVDKKEKNPKECIVVTNSKEGYRIKLYMALSCSLKVSEVLNEIQKRIAYEISHRFNVKVANVDVYVQTIINEI